MRLLFILSTLNIIYAKRMPCYVCFHSACYNPSDKIFKDSKLSGQLAIDRTSNILYYHYQDNASNDFTKAFDLNKAISNFLPNLSFTFAHAVDQTTRELYSSGVKGVYRYNPIKNSTELYALNDTTIWLMQFEEKLYYTEFKQTGLNIYTNKKSKDIPALSKYQIDDFIVDKHGDIYFVSNSALYVFKNGAKRAQLFEDEIYFLTTDKNGDAFFIQPYTRGIYKINSRTRKMYEVGAFSRGLAFKVVFDGDNHIVFYEAKNNILYYLSPVLSRCAVTTRGSGKRSRKVVAITRPNKDMMKFSHRVDVEKNVKINTTKIIHDNRYIH